MEQTEPAKVVSVAHQELFWKVVAPLPNSVATPLKLSLAPFEWATKQVARKIRVKSMSLPSFRHCSRVAQIRDSYGLETSDFGSSARQPQGVFFTHAIARFRWQGTKRFEMLYLCLYSEVNLTCRQRVLCYLSERLRAGVYSGIDH